MKRNGKRLLAMLLCMALALTLLPAPALAARSSERSETPAGGAAEVRAEAPGGDGSADLAAGTVQQDGAVSDTWVQIEGSKQGTPVAPAVNSAGQMVLSAVTGNGNNLDNQHPAIFVDTTMNKILSALDGNAEKTLSFTVTPTSTGDWFGFAPMLFYNGGVDGNAHAYHIGYPSGNSTGWFVQYYGGTGAYPSFDGPDLVKDTPVSFEIKWSNAGVSSFKINGTAITLPNSGGLGNVPTTGLDTANNPDGLKGVAFKVGGKDSKFTTLRLSDVHYTGQATYQVYDISGTVKDNANAALAGVNVTAVGGGKTYTAVTSSTGAYTIENVPAGSYTVTAVKTGYAATPLTVTVSTASLTGQNITMTESDVVQIPTDGAKNGDWAQVEATKRTNNSDPAEVDGVLTLTSGDDNGYKIASSPNMALFLSPKMTTALGSATGDTRTVSFTLTPESVKESPDGVPDYLAFAVVLDSNESNQGFMISYSQDEGGWLIQRYGGGSGSSYSTSLGGAPTPTPGQAMQFEITWSAADTRTDQSTVAIKINGKAVTNSITMNGLPKTNKVAFGVGGKSYADTARQSWRHTQVKITNLRYSGQETVAARYVSGTVKNGSAAVEGATVTVAGDTAGAYTQTTDATGKFKVALPIRAEAYTLNISKLGLAPGTASVTVSQDADKATLVKNVSLVTLPTISGTVKDAQGKALVNVAVALDDQANTVTTNASGAFTLIGAVAGERTLTLSKEGYETTTQKVTVGAPGSANVTGIQITLPDRVIPNHVLSTDGMDVTVAQAFPQVIRYTLKGALAGKTMNGQTAELDTIKINGVAVQPAVTSVKSEDGTKVTYTMVVNNLAADATNGVNATITAELRVGLSDINKEDSAAKDRTLGFYITGVEYAGADASAKAAARLANPVRTIEIPKHSLVSVRSTETGASVKGATLASNTVTSGDVEYVAAGTQSLDAAKGNWFGDYFAAFVYNNQLSAGLSSNAAYAKSGSAGNQCYPVRAQFEAKDGETVTSIGLGSTLWYYDENVTNHEAGADQKLGNALTDAQKIMAPTAAEMPWAKVVIAGDENGNGKVDWQDGAICLRETVMHKPANSDHVADSVNLRISMNFGSMAANPFLIALDNVKRVAAHTDGLGQFVLLKGYGGEGHDSNHPQYSNIGVRMGGAADMTVLMKEGRELGATFGIHTNASEFYAEAIADQNQVRRYSNGGLHYGWNWLDQGIAINAVYDMAANLRKPRWDALYAAFDQSANGGYNVKGYPFVVYVDVWGNNTSGTEDDYMTRKLSNEIVAPEHQNWRIAQEWSWANPYESTFQHWVTDYTYGTYSDKGKLNSEVLRFLLNQYKDSFPPDFATFGGAANAPLLGGPAMQGFEGWQGDGEYNLSIYNTFNQMVYTKFLQHYPVTEWIDATNTVSIPYSKDANGARSSNADWKPEMQIKLSDGTDNIVVTRGTDSRVDATASFSLANEATYRSRVVTLNGKTIVTGAPASAGEDSAFPASKATLKYLIPWYWDNTGARVAADKEKLYHWNAQGGSSTWELPKGWESLATVKVYELSDQGRGTEKIVNVSGGKVTLTATANTAYVVTRGAEAPTITYGTGLHLVDPSFNIDMPKSPWTVAGNGSAIRALNKDGTSVLKMVGAVSVSQEMTGLVAGKNYVSYVAVENRSNAKASITVTDNTGKVVATNYTIRSIARNYVSSYYLHNGHGMTAGSGSFFQNMFLYFTPEAGKTYTMTLSREAGSGEVCFDDLRTVEYGFNYSGFGAGQTAQTAKGSAALPVVYDAETGAVTELHQDFENVPQGIWPFVVGPVEGVSDNRTHVSELNTPFSQAGWDVKKLDDVIDGNWSIKTNGLSGRNSLVYQTIPQNFRFEPNKVYTVEFDYELGTTGSYQAVVGDGAYAGYDSLTVHSLNKTLELTVPTTPNVTGKSNRANVGHAKFTVVGSTSGQTWIGIYSKGAADNQGTSGSVAAFGGYTDFVLDNLSITLADANKNELALRLQAADEMVESTYISNVVGTSDADAWSAFVTARTAARTVFENDSATEEQVTAALNSLNTAMGNLTRVNAKISGMVKNAENDPVAGAVLTLEDATFIPMGLKVTTGDDGTYEFVSHSGVELIPATYRIKVQATGYNVVTTNEITVTKDAAEQTKDIALEAEAPGAYVNDFNDGDIRMMGFLVPEKGENNAATAGLPTLEATERDGSGALKITWNASSGETRHLNNVVDKTMKMANGSFSFDVTSLTNNGVRFGITFRGQMGTTALANRVFVGQQDAVKKWFVEYWNGSSTSWTAVTEKEIGLNANVTRNVRAVMNGKRFTVFVDGIQIYDIDASTDTEFANMPTEAGYVGFNMRGQPGSEYIVDNLRIVSSDAPAANTYNVSGTVKRGTEPVAGATVNLYKGSEFINGTATNALGAYKITGVAPGTYTVKVFASSHTEVTQSLTVGTANVTDKNFALKLDTSKLTALINEVKALKEADYTPESWAALQTALTAAQAINANSTVAAIETAYRDLSNAKSALTEKEKDPTDFSGLRALYAEKALVENEGYSNSTWTAFQNALKKALDVLGNGNATQKQVDDAKTALQRAFKGLKVGADPSGGGGALPVISTATGEDGTKVEKTTDAAQNVVIKVTDASGEVVAEVKIPAVIPESETRFADVPEGHWADKAIHQLAAIEVVKGISDTQFNPVAPMKRGDLATVLFRLSNGKAGLTDSFSDVAAGKYYADGIAWAAKAGVVQGYSDTEFQPETVITREQLAVMLMRYAKLLGVETEANALDLAKFDDAASTHTWAADAMAWCVKSGIIQGMDDTTLSPTTNVTRAQVAVMLNRFLGLVK